MADFFSRLAERALGLAVVARPVIAPVFAPPPQLAIESVADTPARAVHQQPPSPPHHAPAPAVETLRQTRGANEPAPRASSPLRADAVTAASEHRTPRQAVLVQRVEPETRSSDRQQQPASPIPRPEEPRVQTPAVTEPTIAQADVPTRVESIQQRPEAAEPVPAISRHITLPFFPPIERPVSEPRPRVNREPYQTDPSTIRVSIGRIEVRAVFPEPPPSGARPATDSALSLGEYLRQRDGGKR
jgi:hypothetical protein